MTDQPARPYTDDDLRAEAARQHSHLTDRPSFDTVGDLMTGQEVTPDGGVDWDDFRDETFSAAQQSVHALITGAADVSEWAVNLGADGLQPSDQQLHIGDNRVRIHFAFAPDMTEVDRRDFVALIASAVITGA
ncbi:hypothetical protein AB0B30_32650 [Streptomyces narbonensis]|uniref:Uncharacterized protein n=1 Tax=Streptomyces narbonensis TaxID=67333 RepID=A0ABV3CKQ8_9ACTN